MACSYQVTIVGLDEQIKKLEGCDAALQKELTAAMKKAVISIQGGARMAAPVGVSGRLRNSIGYQVSGVGSNITGWVGSTLKDEAYPSVMEFGRKPGKMPPISALERWVSIVLGVPDNEVHGVAYLIARKIARVGIKGKFFLQNAYDASRSSIELWFAQALENVTRALVVRR